jgi:serine/threonine protein kinase
MISKSKYIEETKIFFASNSKRGERMTVIQNYSVLKELGRGNFGATFLAKGKPDRRKVCIEKISLEGTLQAEQMKYFEKAAILATVDHPNIVRLHHSFCENDRFYIVMEYCCFGTL